MKPRILPAVLVLAALLMAAPAAQATRTAPSLGVLEAGQLPASLLSQPAPCPPPVQPILSPNDRAIAAALASLDEPDRTRLLALRRLRLTGPAASLSRLEPLAWGQETASKPFFWPGAPNLWETRLLNPALRQGGLFLELDPLGPVDSPNLYQAFGFDGLNVRDPWGLQDGDEPILNRFFNWLGSTRVGKWLGIAQHKTQQFSCDVGHLANQQFQRSIASHTFVDPQAEELRHEVGDLGPVTGLQPGRQLNRGLQKHGGEVVQRLTETATQQAIYAATAKAGEAALAGGGPALHRICGGSVEVSGGIGETRFLRGGPGKSTGAAPEARAIEGEVTLLPYSEGKGHHISARSAFRGDTAHSASNALAIPRAELERLGVSHASITGAQQTLYRQFAASGNPLTWSNVAQIEQQALVAGGMDAGKAASAVQRAIAALQQAGVQEPARIPWGG